MVLTFQWRTAIDRAGHRLKITCVQPLEAAALVTAVLLIPTHPAAAQETRAETIQQAQAERIADVRPPAPKFAERVIDRLEDWGLIVGQPRGVYPWLGSVFPGGGLAGGAGVRQPFGDDGAFNVFGGYSVDTYSRAQADLSLPSFASDRVRLTLSGRYIDAPDVRYFGVGNSTHSSHSRPTCGSSSRSFVRTG